MSVMDVSIVLRLKDDMSAPAKKAAEALKGVIAGLNDLKKIGGGLEIGKSLKEASAATRYLSADWRSLSSSIRAASDASRSMVKEMAATRGRSWISAEVKNLKEFAALQQRITRGGHISGAGFIGGYYGARMAAHGVKSFFDQGGKLDSQQAMLELAGYDPGQRRKMIVAARSVQRQIPQFTEAQALHGLREVSFATGDLDKAVKYLPLLAKADAIIAASSLGEQGARNFHSQMMELTKSGEMKNYIADEGAMRHFIDMSVKQAIATAGRITPAVTFASLKYFRSGLHGVGREFLDFYMPELNQELMKGRGAGQGGSAGNPLESWVSATVAGKLSKNARAAWSAAHLLGSDGKPVDGVLAATNPKAWSDRYILPWLRSRGIDPAKESDHARVVKAVSELYENRTARQIAQIMAIQSEQMEKRRKILEKTFGLEGYARLMRTWDTNVQALNAQTEQLAAVLARPLLPAAISAVEGVRNMFMGVSDWARSHPLRTLGIEGLLGGAGLAALSTAIGRRIIGSLVGVGVGAMAGGPLGALVGGVLGQKLLGGIVAGAESGIAAGAASTGARMGGILASGLIAGVMRVFSVAGVLYAIDQAIYANLSPKTKEDLKKREDAINGLKPSAGTSKADLLRQQFNKERAGLGIPLITVPVPLPMANPLRKPLAGLGWDESGFASLAQGPSLFRSAEEAARNWAEKFIGLVRAIFDGATIPGPNVTSPAAPSPSHFIAPRSGGIGHAMNIHGGVHITVNGAGAPHRVAEEVHRVFRQSTERHLSDGAFAI